MLQCNEEVSVNHKLYKIIKLLGHGKGGYSYLAENEKSLVVLKQIHHEPAEVKESHIIQARKMAELAYNAGLNIDYYPTNFIVQKNQNNEDVLFYIDYECNN